MTRDFAGALQWLGDTDRDTDQEYLFRFGLAGFTSLVADMNGDGVDDAVAVDTSTVSGFERVVYPLWSSWRESVPNQ